MQLQVLQSWVTYTPGRKQPYTVWYREPWPLNEASVIAFCASANEVNAVLRRLEAGEIDG